MTQKELKKKAPQKSAASLKKREGIRHRKGEPAAKKTSGEVHRRHRVANSLNNEAERRMATQINGLGGPGLRTLFRKDGSTEEAQGDAAAQKK